MAHQTLWEEKGISWEFSGEVTDEELTNLNTESYGDPRFLGIKYQIVNFLKVREFNATIHTIAKVAEMDKGVWQKNSGIKVAIIASKLVIKGWARVYVLEAGRDMWEVNIFEDEVSAREWL